MLEDQLRDARQELEDMEKELDDARRELQQAQAELSESKLMTELPMLVLSCQCNVLITAMNGTVI